MNVFYPSVETPVNSDFQVHESLVLTGGIYPKSATVAIFSWNSNFARNQQ